MSPRLDGIENVAYTKFMAAKGYVLGIRTKIVGSLGAIPKQLGNRLRQIGITVGTAQVQKTVLLGTARTLRKVLEI